MSFNPNEHMMPLKGKQYLEVKWRLVWFREDHPDWCIDTKLERFDPEKNHAIFSCKIFDENGVQKSAGYGSESVKDFADFIEKAETKAIGRALAMLGYGTQFAPELEEGERIVDAPVERKTQLQQPQRPAYFCADCGMELTPYNDQNGNKVSLKKHVEQSHKVFGRCLCLDCIGKIDRSGEP